MSEANLKIVMTKHGQGKVYYNGQELEGVRSLTLDLEAGEKNLVDIELNPAKIEFSGPVEHDGFLTVNELRKNIGLPPIDDGDLLCFSKHFYPPEDKKDDEN